MSYFAVILVWNRSKCCTGVAMFSAVNPHECRQRLSIIFGLWKVCFMLKMPDAIFSSKLLHMNAKHKH